MGWIKCIKEWNKRRKKGLKNPVILWVSSFILTFVLTILPSAFVNSLIAGDSSKLFDENFWEGVITDNLYPMLITQSVVTMLQNVSIATPSKEERQRRRFSLGIGWTYALGFFLLIYVILYPIIAYANPSWRNLALYIFSGILAAVGLASVLELTKEQERIRKAIKKEKIEKQQAERAKMLRDADRTLAGSPPQSALSDDDVSHSEVEEVTCHEDEDDVLPVP